MAVQELAFACADCGSFLKEQADDRDQQKFHSFLSILLIAAQLSLFCGMRRNVALAVGCLFPCSLSRADEFRRVSLLIDHGWFCVRCKMCPSVRPLCVFIHIHGTAATTNEKYIELYNSKHTHTHTQHSTHYGGI